MTTSDEALPPAEPPSPDALDAALSEVVAGDHLSPAKRELLRSMLATLFELAQEDTDVLDLKIAQAALGEMAEAFRVFGPYRSVRKLSMFGSARTLPADPVYVLARDLAARLAGAGWMVVTGAGPGIMAAGSEGAGRAHAFGVNIRLPHEEGANPFIAQDPKLVEMRYFFTRKLMLIKESHGYAVLPGGFGTLDEGFELLTLLQTGKAEPAPVVLVETPGGTYWKGWRRFIDEEVVRPGFVSPEDVSLFKVADSVDAAADEVLGFYRNYHSCRWVGDLLVLRLQVMPSAAEVQELNRRFADIVVSGSIRPASPFPPERTGNDHL
ncbi:MAG: TIGR00730 family Rossman fold protein, partial [Acidimicrobiales bacterium]